MGGLVRRHNRAKFRLLYTLCRRRVRPFPSGHLM